MIFVFSSYICDHVLLVIMFPHKLFIVLIIMIIRVFHDVMWFYASYDDFMQIYTTHDDMWLIVCGSIMLMLMLCYL
jgi:hypothetical protein